jgi:ferredoxin
MKEKGEQPMSFEVELKKSGKTIVVPDGERILDALVKSGIYVDTSCQEGVCGTCLTAVLEGTPDHRDEYQTDAEKAANTHITVCCSGALTPKLVLDL